jgi:hypothetical protein
MSKFPLRKRTHPLNQLSLPSPQMLRI